MLSAKELMIGDIVRLVYRVGTFVSKVNLENLIDNREGKMEYEPIPLTPEILEKNEFEKFMSYHDRDIHNIRLTYYWHENSITIRPFNHNPWIELAPVRNVHELQHCLRLCGLNELADGFKV